MISDELREKVGNLNNEAALAPVTGSALPRASGPIGSRACARLPWYYEGKNDVGSWSGHCRDEPTFPGTRYRREWPTVGDWVTVPNPEVRDAAPAK